MVGLASFAGKSALDPHSNGKFQSLAISEEQPAPDSCGHVEMKRAGAKPEAYGGRGPAISPQAQAEARQNFFGKTRLEAEPQLRYCGSAEPILQALNEIRG